MKRPLDWIFAALVGSWLLFSVLACACGFRVYVLLGDLRHDAGGLTAQLSTTLAQMNATQRDASTKLATEQTQFGEAMVAFKHIVERSDQQLFGRDLKSGLFGQARQLLGASDQLLADSDATVKAQNDSLLETQAQLRTSLATFSRDSSVTLDHSKNLLDQLSQDAQDPAIQASLQHVALATDNIAGTTKDLKDVADKFRSDYLKPQKFAWELLKSLAGMGGSFAQMVK